jgi:hypothetical protein
VVSVTDLYARILGFLDRSRYFSIKLLLSCTHEAEWTPFQTHYFYIHCVRIYKTVILPVVLYGCETWSLTLREEHRLRVFENRMLRRIFGPKRDEVTGE